MQINYRLIHATMRSMVKEISCYEEASIVLSQGIGTISKKMNGSAAWTISDLIALEEYTQKNSVSKILNREENTQDKCKKTLVKQLSVAARECGDAISLSSLATGENCNSDTSAVALVEINEAIEALEGLKCRLSADGECNV